MSEVAEKPTRDQEVRRLAEELLTYLDPKDVANNIDSNVEIDESNEEHGFEITAEEVSEVMSFIVETNAKKIALINQTKARMNGARRPLAKVPYRDWLAGMIYAGYNNFTVKMSIEYADKMIKELYPIEGEIDEDSRD